MRAAPRLVVALAVVAACDRAPSTPPPAPATDAVAAVVVAPPPASGAAPPVSAEASARAAPEAEARAAAPPASATPEPAPSSAPSPLPAVRVENIGMHIGGGPNDAANKAPIAESVAPHFDELRACWSQVSAPKKAGDFGVDLLIQPGGGRAEVSHPRTSLGPDAFRDCVVAVFARVDFRKPLKGLTKVSYALRFTPPP